MKKILFSVVLLFCAASAKAVQFKVVCCDGTIHYCQGISLKAYYENGASLEEVNEYEKLIGQNECKLHGNCYKSVEELNSSGTITLSAEDISRWDFFLQRVRDSENGQLLSVKGKA